MFNWCWYLYFLLVICNNELMMHAHYGRACKFTFDFSSHQCDLSTFLLDLEFHYNLKFMENLLKILQIKISQVKNIIYPWRETYYLSCKWYKDGGHLFVLKFVLVKFKHGVKYVRRYNVIFITWVVVIVRLAHCMPLTYTYEIMFRNYLYLELPIKGKSHLCF